MNKKIGKWAGILLCAVGLSIQAEYSMFYATRIWVHLLIWLVVAFALLLEFFPLKKALFCWGPLAIGGILLWTPFTLSSQGFVTVRSAVPRFTPHALYRPVTPGSSLTHLLDVPVWQQDGTPIISTARGISIFGRQWELMSLNMVILQKIKLESPREEDKELFRGDIFPVLIECIRYPDAERSEERDNICRSTIPGKFSENIPVYMDQIIRLPRGQYEVVITAQETTVRGVPSRPHSPFAIPTGEDVEVESYFYGPHRQDSRRGP